MQNALLPDTLRLILDRVVEGVVIHDASGRVIWVNPSARRILGDLVLPEGEHGPLRWSAVREDGAEVPWEEHPVMKALESAQRSSGTVLGIEQKDGTRRWLSVSADPVCLGEGRKGTIAVSTYVDISAIRDGVARLNALEAQLRQAQKMEAVGQLTGGIAHDFNNLLTAILTNADLLTDALEGAPPDARAELDDLRRAARHGAELVRKLTTFSRRGKAELVKVEPATMLYDASRLIRRVVPEHIELETDMDVDLPPISADPAGLEQVLVNLATNARDAMPKGGVLRLEARRIVLAAADCDALGWGRPGTILMLVISDDGVGMDAETLERIYEPFFTTKPIGEGTGLGMSIVYGIIQQHGGHIRVESQPGRGTRIELRFPPLARGSREMAGESGARAPRGHETILLVEDNESVRAATRRILEHQGYKVVAASTGQDALQLYQVHGSGIAMVLADVVMPKMSGVDLAAALRRLNGGIKVLLTSGYTDRADEAAALGVPLFLKPWTPAQLAARVREVLDGKEEAR